MRATKAHNENVCIYLLQGYLYKKSSKPLNKDWKKKYVTLCDDGKLTYHPSLHVSVPFVRRVFSDSCSPESWKRWDPLDSSINGTGINTGGSNTKTIYRQVFEHHAALFPQSKPHSLATALSKISWTKI